MPSARVLAVRAALLGIVLASGACFRPKILSGGFKCDTTPGAKSCPDDFVCVGGFCVTPATDAGTDMAKGGSGGMGGGGGGGGGGHQVDAATDLPCLPAVPNCQPSDAGLCDPVCNVGCTQCDQKCSAITTLASNNGFLSGDLTCNPLILTPPGSAPKGALANCTQHSASMNKQTDDCAPGMVCLALECASRCYQLCRSTADCTNNATCSRDAGGGYSFCDVPPTFCDPTPAPYGQTGCTANATAMGCYMGTDTKQTVCDCPFGANQNGGMQRGQGCTHSRQCGVGLVCFDYTGTGSPICLQVCHLPGDGGTNTECSLGARTCSAFSSGNNANKVYGYCPLP